MVKEITSMVLFHISPQEGSKSIGKVNAAVSVSSEEVEDEFYSELTAAGDKLVIVDFTAVWCGPCQRIKPFFEKLCSENSDVAFLKVDVDKNEELTEKYEVTSMPTFLFIKCGKKIDSFSGADEKKLEAKLKELK